MMETTIPMEIEKKTEKQTCDISDILSSHHTDVQSTKSDNMSFLKPDKPKIMVEPVCINPTPCKNNQIVNPTPCKQPDPTPSKQVL